MTREKQFETLIKNLGKLLIVRIFIYAMAGRYALRLLFTPFWPSGIGNDYWIGVARETGRDLTIIVGLFSIQNTPQTTPKEGHRRS